MTGAGVSAVIVSYHTGPLLARCLDSLLGQPELAEVLLVDNGNSPEVVMALRARAESEPRLRLLTGHGNVGFAAGCNLGADAATGSHLLFLNPDAAMPEGGLARLLAEISSREGMALIGGRLVGPDGEEQAGSRRDHLTPGRAITEMFRLDRVSPLRRFNRHQEPLPGETIPVPTISGACILLAVEDYGRIGGMDERYFLHVEDIDFCLRFREAGGEVLFCPHVDILHEKGTSGAAKARVEKLKAESLTRYFRLHFADRTPPGLVNLAIALVWSGMGARLVLAALKGKGNGEPRQ